jgi:lipoyl synthase
LGIVPAKTIMKRSSSRLEVLDWGTLQYHEALQRQKSLVLERVRDASPDRLVLVEHPAVVTIGRSGDLADLRVPDAVLREKGIDLYWVERGGKVTFHGLGQLVAYPIIKLLDKDLRKYIEGLLESVAGILREFGLQPERRNMTPGLWVSGKKIASVGVAIQGWVTYHGISLNVNVDLAGFDLIIACGESGLTATSLQTEVGTAFDLPGIKELFIREFARVFRYRDVVEAVWGGPGHPDWLIRPAPSSTAIDQMEEMLREIGLATVCQSARCPNLGECFGRGTATFMILGSTCTRNCRFCAVDSGVPEPINSDEPQRVARAARKLGLKHVVITSVTRDDLKLGGAEQFSRTIEAVKTLCPTTTVEVLVPDFEGSVNSLQTVVQARPDIFNHNLETVPRLYPTVRPQAKYGRSLGVLEYAARSGLRVKSGLMLGLGETTEEILATLKELKRAGCLMVTLGQYLSPSKDHLPVARYVSPLEFDELARIARILGFTEVAAGPLIRSSYRANEMFAASEGKRKQGRNGWKAVCRGNWHGN